MPEGKRKRLSLLSALIDVGAEVISRCMTGERALIDSREPDAAADAHVATARRLALHGAQRAAVLGPDLQPLFLRIVAECDGYVVADAREDAHVARGHGEFGGIRQIARGMNRALTRELAKRGWTGGHES
jgi:hypothetical protein